MNSLYNINSNNNQNRGENKPPHKKNFKDLKKNTITSLNNVEFFLNNLNHFSKFFKIYKILKLFK